MEEWMLLEASPPVHWYANHNLDCRIGDDMRPPEPVCQVSMEVTRLEGKAPNKMLRWRRCLSITRELLTGDLQWH